MKAPSNEENAMPTETAPPATAAQVPTASDPTEVELIHEINKLWQVHTSAQTSLRKNRDELRVARADLSRRLAALKAILSRPGRGGQWSSFLKSREIPRATADRLVRGYEKALKTGPDNCLSEQITEPTEVVVHRYLHAIWPKLSRVLRSPEAVEMFVRELRHKAEEFVGGQNPVSDSLQDST